MSHLPDAVGAPSGSMALVLDPPMFGGMVVNDAGVAGIEAKVSPGLTPNPAKGDRDLCSKVMLPSQICLFACITACIVVTEHFAFAMIRDEVLTDFATRDAWWWDWEKNSLSAMTSIAKVIAK